MTLQLEEGKYYRARNGEKIGPIWTRDGYFVGNDWHFSETGRCGLYGKNTARYEHLDLVAEWVDPVAAPLPPLSEIDHLLDEREKVHGEFWKTAEIAQDLKGCIASHIEKRLDPVHDEALDMIASKIARILSGDANHVDHWIDIAGYAQLGAKFAEARTEK